MDRTLSERMWMVRLIEAYGRLLTAHQQRVLRLYYLDDLSLGEIAARLHVTRQAAAGRGGPAGHPGTRHQAGRRWGRCQGAAPDHNGAGGRAAGGRITRDRAHRQPLLLDSPRREVAPHAGQGHLAWQGVDVYHRSGRVCPSWRGRWYAAAGRSDADRPGGSRP